MVFKVYVWDGSERNKIGTADRLVRLRSADDLFRSVGEFRGRRRSVISKTKVNI